MRWGIHQPSELSSFEQQQLLDFLVHHMSQEVRQKLMFALPEQYNKLVGQRIMTVEKTSCHTPPPDEASR